MAFDQALLDTMSDEERAAIEDVDPEAQAVAEEAADDGDEGDDDVDEASGDEPAEAAAAPAAEKTEASAADEAKTSADAPVAAAAAESDAGQAEPPARQAPNIPLVFDLPPDFQQRMDAIKASKVAIVDKYHSGDITFEQYNAELEKINDGQRQLDAIQNTAHVSTLMRQQAEEARRTSAAQSVIDDAKRAGLDYEDEAKYAELRATMSALFNVKSHAEKGWDHVLREADRRMRAAYGVGSPAPAATKTAAQLKAEAAAARAPDLSSAPKTLANVPGGQGPGDVGSDFDDVLALEGEAYEAAIAEMAAKNPARFSRFQAEMQ